MPELTERTVLDRIEIVHRTGQIQVRLRNEIVRHIGAPQERIVSTDYWRGVIDPGDAAKADALGVRAVADTVWTSEVLEAWATTRAA